MRRVILIAFLFFIGVAGLLIYAWPATQVPDSAVVDMQVDGPDGRIWNGTVTAAPGTAFHALLAASDAGDFTVQWTGQGARLYVQSIAGHDDTGGGWCVQTDDRSGAGWQDSPVSPALREVHDGWGVRYYWTDGQCDRF